MASSHGSSVRVALWTRATLSLLFHFLYFVLFRIFLLLLTYIYIYLPLYISISNCARQIESWDMRAHDMCTGREESAINRAWKSTCQPRWKWNVNIDVSHYVPGPCIIAHDPSLKSMKFAIAARFDDAHVYSGPFMQSNANKYATM